MTFTELPVAPVPQMRGPTAPTDETQQRSTASGETQKRPSNRDGTAKPATEPLIIELTDAPRRSAADQPVPELDGEIEMEAQGTQTPSDAHRRDGDQTAAAMMRNDWQCQR